MADIRANFAAMKTRDEKNNHDTVIPPDKGYSNMHGKTRRQIKAENGFWGIDFNDGRADFRPVSKAEVVFDWERELGKEGIRHIVETGDRQYLHEAGVAMLAIVFEG